jgi:hypothetical protein
MDVYLFSDMIEGLQDFLPVERLGQIFFSPRSHRAQESLRIVIRGSDYQMDVGQFEFDLCRDGERSFLVTI